MTRTDPLFVVGPQRSGTTALGLALSAALAAAGGCFTVNGKLPYMLRRWWTDEDAAARHLRADEVASALTRIPPQGAGAAAWLTRTGEALTASAGRAACGAAERSAIAEVRRVCSEAYGSGPWGDKYNEYLLELPWLHAAFPDATWVFLARDPGEAVASMLAWRRDKPWNPGDAAAASAKWADWTSRWLEFRDRVPACRRVELDYADLCAGLHGGLSELLGHDVGGFLAGFRYRRPTGASAPLGPSAHTVHTALLDLGILGAIRTTSSALSGGHHG
jgi:hypothetical protein